MGLAVAHRFAAAGHDLQLAARDARTLEAEQTDLQLRHGVSVTLHDYDATDVTSLESFIDSLPALPVVAVIAVRLLGDQERSDRDLGEAVRVMRSNYEGPAATLAVLANRFEARGSGTLVGISSAVGERGRATNYTYGSAKAGFTAFLSGLRNRLAKKGVHVVTVLPGFVATRMTEGMDLPRKLLAQPEDVAEAIWTAVTRKRNVIYVSGIWFLIMLIIRNIPEPIFKRLKL